MAKQRHVVIGTGTAAVAAAQGMRTAGFDGEIVLIGEEPQLPYERPPLSKAVLKGTTDLAKLSLRPEGWYSDNRVELLRGERVSKLDLRSGRVELSSGNTVDFDKILLATGGSPRKLPLDRHERVFVLRTVSDAERLENALGYASHIVVVGGGFIGCEVTATARERGIEVTVIESGSGPMVAALGDDISAVFQRIHREAGVRFVLNDAIAMIDDVPGAAVVQTKGGERLECDAVLVCIGLVPRTELLAGTPVILNNGICTDTHCRTAVRQVFAAGDVARFEHPAIKQAIRIEHHDNALSQGAIAGRNMAGESLSLCDTPWVWSDQYDHNLQVTGFPDQADETVMRGDPAANRFCRFYLRQKCLIGAIGLNQGRDITAARRLIGRGVTMDTDLLGDSSVPIMRASLAHR